MAELPAPSALGAERRIVCGRCGTAFTCRPAEGCWCAEESFRLRMPVDGTDCVCPTCLRTAAQAAMR